MAQFSATGLKQVVHVRDVRSSTPTALNYERRLCGRRNNLTTPYTNRAGGAARRWSAPAPLRRQSAQCVSMNRRRRARQAPLRPTQLNHATGGGGNAALVLGMLSRTPRRRPDNTGPPSSPTLHDHTTFLGFSELSSRTPLINGSAAGVTTSAARPADGRGHQAQHVFGRAGRHQHGARA